MPRQFPWVSARQRGFTLIELLVAIVLLAIMGALSYGAYRNANVQSEALESTAARTRELQVAVAAMVMDLQQLVPRPARETIGDGYRPALRAGAAGQVLELTRGGYPNGAGLPRGTLQRVTYVLEGSTLVRQSSAVVDATGSTPLLRRDLLKRVKSISVRFMNASHVWQDVWPPVDAPPEQIAHIRPLAVEFTLDTEDFGAIVRLVEIPG
jgi:general secretion pathway protein J